MHRSTSTIAACLLVAASLVPGRASALVTLTGPSGMDWDINDTASGYLTDGENDTWDEAYYLSTNSVQYTAGGIAGTVILAGRGVRMAQHYVTSEITVQRTAWVPATGTHDCLRYLDTFANGGSSTLPVTATYTGTLGSNYDTFVVASSSGDTLISTADAWYATHDTYGYDTPTGAAWWDGRALAPTSESLSSDYFTTTFQFDLPPLSTVALMIFVVQEATTATAQATLEWLADLPEEAMAGLSSDEMMQILNWQAGGAPVIRVLTDPLEVDEGGDLLLEVDVEDLEGDAFTVEWDLDGDGAFDDATGLTATWSAAGMDGPASGAAAVRATDSGGESRETRLGIVVRNAAPIYSSDPAVDPGLVAHRGGIWEYRIAVDDPANTGGITRDPVTVTVPVKPTGMIFYGDLRLKWTIPDSVDVIGDHQVRIEADDHEDGLGVQDFLITIPENTPPPAPAIVSPETETVAVLRPTLVIENIVDVEGDPIIYTFQVDTAGAFTTETLVAVGQRNAAAGPQTTWTIDVDLEDLTRYYWRVWADDGTEESPASLTYFDVDLSAAVSDPDPDASPDDPTDSSTDTGWDLQPPGESGCSCALAGSEGGSGSWPAGLVLAGMIALACAGIRRRAAPALAAVVAVSCGGGGKDVEVPRIDLEPFSEVSAVEIIEKVITERELESVRGEDVWVVGHGWWKVDLWVEGLPLVIEYLDDGDRTKLGKTLTSSKIGDHFKLVAVGLEEIGEGVQITSVNSRYCVVFDDRDYVFQPNPTSEDRYDVTIFEIQKRLRKDAVDVIEELTRILANLAEEEGGGGEGGKGE